MKNGRVLKSAAAHDAEREMALVNAYSRRKLNADEVYLFSVALCDNDIDRDCERFTKESLEALAGMFVGKTGIFDHEPSAKNQKARIISCEVVKSPDRRTAAGEELATLTARAYIPRTQGNAELIEAIDSGIVKEVSVGCSIKSKTCSICGADIRSPECSHIKGQSYGGRLCCAELREPTDAYEFSFTAIPAQRAAGVIKSRKKEKDMTDITKLLESEQATLDSEDMAALRKYIGALKADAEDVKAYKAQLLKGLKRGLEEKGVELNYETARAIGEKLNTAEIRELTAALCKGAGAQAPQLTAGRRDESAGNTEFRI